MMFRFTIVQVECTIQFLLSHCRHIVTSLSLLVSTTVAVFSYVGLTLFTRKMLKRLSLCALLQAIKIQITRLLNIPISLRLL